MSGSDIAGLRAQIKDNASEVLEARSGERWRDTTHRIVVVGREGRFTAIAKTAVIRIEGPPSTSMRGALERLLERTAAKLIVEMERWENMDENDLDIEEELVEAGDGSRYAKKI